MPRKSRARRTYIRPAAARIWPQVAGGAEPERRDRTPRRPGGEEDDEPQERAKDEQRQLPGCEAAGRARSSPSRPRSQKKSVASVPSTPPSARRSSALASPPTTRSARVHCVFRFGPVGPLKNAFCSSPQRPSNAIHGNASRPPPGRSGSSPRSDGARRAGRACRRSRRPPRPSSRCTAPRVNLFACEPAAG